MYTAYKVTINGSNVSTHVKNGMVTNSKLDEELDNAILVLNNTLNNAPYAPCSKVYIELIGHNTPETYIVLQDEVVRQANNFNYYSHTLSLIEPTKYFEKIMLPNLTFRQPKNSEWTSYTIQTALQRLLELCPIYDATKQWRIGELGDYASVVIPEISLNQNNLREACAKIMACANLIPRVYLDANGVLTLSYDEVNKLNNLININTEKTFEYRQMRNAEYYGGALETRLENGTQKYATLKYPSTGWAYVTSSDKSALTTSNEVIEVPFPIYANVKLELYVRYNDGSGYYSEIFDVSNYLVSKDLYDVLPEMTSSNYQSSEANKGNRLYYTVGDNKIYNMLVLQSTKTWLANITGAEQPTLTFILRAIKGALTSTAYSINNTPLFRVQQIDNITSTIRNYKEENVGDTQVFNNQAENLVDMLDFGNSNSGVINKIGNNEINIAKLVMGGNEYQLGDYTSDGFIVSSVSNQYQQDGYVISTANLTKNFNQISKYVGVDSSIRQVPIPYNQPVARLHYDDYCVVSKSALVGYATGLCATSDFLTLFSNYIKGAGEYGN